MVLNLHFTIDHYHGGFGSSLLTAENPVLSLPVLQRWEWGEGQLFVQPWRTKRLPGGGLQDPSAPRVVPVLGTS